MNLLLLVISAFLAALIQTLSGFGFALLLMPLLTLVIGVRTAAPLVALAGLTLYAINLARFRRAVNWAEVARLSLAAALGVPLGVWALVNLDEMLVRRLLGLVLVAYAAYDTYTEWARPGGGPLLPRGWAWLAGFAAGCLGGAYNTPGPPVVVYGSLRRWPKDEFRASLQTLFFFTGAQTVAAHLLARRVTGGVLALYACAAPAMLLGLWLGARLDRKLDPARFRVLVALMIAALGLSLALAS